MEEELLNGKTLLVVDDEVDLRDIMASEMEFMGAKVFQSGNITEAKEVLKNNHIDLIVSDIRMPGGTGIDLLDYVRANDYQQPPIILITGFADITTEDAFDKGAEALLNKPFKLDDLIMAIEKSTLPDERRFIDSELKGNQVLELDFNERIADTMGKRQFLIGRGGVALYIGTQRKKIGIGETLNFDFKFKDLNLKGIAICRWIKILDGGQKALIGLEFLNLEQETLAFFLNYKKQNPSVTFIPVP